MGRRCRLADRPGNTGPRAGHQAPRTRHLPDACDYLTAVDGAISERLSYSWPARRILSVAVEIFGAEIAPVAEPGRELPG